MIIACPACKTRYVVPDDAITEEGRTVRCAKCRHSWFEEQAASTPEPSETEEVAHNGQPAAETVPEAEPVLSAEPERGRAEVPAEAPAEERQAAPEQPRAADEEESSFDPEPPVTRRRRSARPWIWAAVILALVAAGGSAAISAWGMPDWVPVDRPTFAAGQPGLQLDFPPERQSRRQLANGTEFFDASGTVTNTSSETRRIPPILIVLRDGQDRIVYQWEAVPPKRTLAPGESVTINEAVADVPRSARFAEIGWKPE